MIDLANGTGVFYVDVNMDTENGIIASASSGEVYDAIMGGATCIARLIYESNEAVSFLPVTAIYTNDHSVWFNDYQLTSDKKFVLLD